MVPTQFVHLFTHTQRMCKKKEDQILFSLEKMGKYGSSFNTTRRGTQRMISSSIFNFNIFVFAIAFIVLLLFTYYNFFLSVRHNDDNGSGYPHESQDLVSGHLSSRFGFKLVKRYLLGNAPIDLLKARSDQTKQLMNEHRVLARAYASHASKLMLQYSKLVRVFRQLEKNFTNLINQPSYQSLLDPNTDSFNPIAAQQFEKEVKERIKATKQAVAEAKDLFDPHLKVQKLKDTSFLLNDQLVRQKKDADFSNSIAAKSVPKCMHCLTLRLTQERIENPSKYVQEGAMKQPEFEDPELYHYAIFSDNVLAASVVVNSLVQNAKEPWKHVLHIVTDKLNWEAMHVMFKLKDYNGVHIEVKGLEDYKFLNSSYVPVLRPRKSAESSQSVDPGNQRHDRMRQDSVKVKFKNPKYFSILNHVRFYLPEMFPTLHKILFLDDDVVVQKDLTGLWEVDLDGKVNGAVETCFGSFHRLAQYLNFSVPLIKEKFDPKSCAWAYGMNMFDLDAWRRKKCTEEYHYWQNLHFENRNLWKLGTLPPGLITFYSTTRPLDKSWHVLGLGYNPSIRMDEIQNAAVVHFNGDRKPWLDIAINKFRPIWSKYVDYDLEPIQTCNIT